MNQAHESQKGKFGNMWFGGIKGSLAKPSEVDLNFDTWLEMLNPTS